MGRIRVGVIDDQEVFTRGVVACLGEDEGLEIVEFDGTLPGPGAVDVLVISGPPTRRSLPCPAVVCYGRPADAARLAARPGDHPKQRDSDSDLPRAVRPGARVDRELPASRHLRTRPMWSRFADGREKLVSGCVRCWEFQRLVCR